ncbi:lysozyme [Dokdonella sp. MW10]|uniref:lysozyme n=1 Tax=Dokdonella sp. MW10 TaxID=2992926 RepID=UPI003F82330B
MSKGKIIGGTAASVVLAAAPVVAYFEGVIPQTYIDPVGIPTVCAGETGPHVAMGQSYTVEQCMRMLDDRLLVEWRKVEPCIGRPVTVPQATAILSWSYNVGAGAACRSTLLRQLNAGQPAEVWCQQLSRWTKATVMGVSVELPGLVKRRASERAMCETR